MKLIVNCQKCKAEIKTPNKANSRINYFKKYGEQFDVKCIECNETNTYSVDDIKAVDYNFGELLMNRIAVLIVILLASFFLSFFFIGIGGAIIISIVAVLLFSLIAKKNNSNANLDFNRHKVRGRMTNIGK